MKRLNDLINEEDEKKNSGDPSTIEADRGMDDEKFVLIMEAYKRMRKHDRKNATKLYEKAQDLIKKGDVSPKALLAAAYI